MQRLLLPRSSGGAERDPDNRHCSRDLAETSTRFKKIPGEAASTLSRSAREGCEGAKASGCRKTIDITVRDRPKQRTMSMSAHHRPRQAAHLAERAPAARHLGPNPT